MTRWRAFPFAFLLVFVFYATVQRYACAVTQAVENKNVTERVPLEGCIECGYYRCPANPGRCLLGAVPDPCGCCPDGLCARFGGEPCWNSSISVLSSLSHNDGYCAKNYLCELRSDLQDEDPPEAICVCIEQSPVCGNNNKTYTTSCELHEEAVKLRNSSLKLQHPGPCQSRPWILSNSENVTSFFGQRVALNCEAKGFPVPDIFWEFYSTDGRRVLKLPVEEHEATVHSSEGPEPFMQTSWMQLARLSKEHIGTYRCIANNSMGTASATLSVLTS